MPKLIFCSLLALLLVVSCECKDMHVRRMPDEKDIVFEGKAKADPSKKTKTYVPNEQREIQVYLTSSDEEAQGRPVQDPVCHTSGWLTCRRRL